MAPVQGEEADAATGTDLTLVGIGLSNEELGKLQSDDPDLQPLLRWVEAGGDPPVKAPRALHGCLPETTVNLVVLLVQKGAHPLIKHSHNNIAGGILRSFGPSKKDFNKLLIFTYFVLLAVLTTNMQKKWYLPDQNKKL